MSIYVEILRHVGKGDLFHLAPALPGAIPKRRLYITPEVRRLIVGPWTESIDQQRGGRLRGDLDAYTEGYRIRVALASESMFLDADMKQLRPAGDEIWTIRSTDPPPGIRIFGSFAATDLFIALTWSLRTPLGLPDSQEWKDAIKIAQHKWRRLFPSYPPMSGGSVNDYISRNARKAVS